MNKADNDDEREVALANQRIRDEDEVKIRQELEEQEARRKQEADQEKDD